MELHQLAAEESSVGSEFAEVKDAHSEEAVGHAVMEAAEVQLWSADCTLDQSEGMAEPLKGPRMPLGGPP